MQKVLSKLENNKFSNVVVKKGLNLINDKDFKTLSDNTQFKSFVEKGYIQIKAKAKKINTEKPDFNSMDYNELKKYIKNNNIEVPSLKKDDILNVLNKI